MRRFRAAPLALGCAGRGPRRAARAERSDDGAVMVEFALVVPVLLMLLVGIIQFGQAYNTQLALQASAREGARAAALGQSPAEVTTRVEEAAAPHDDIAIDLTEAVCPADGDGQAKVSVSKTFTFGIPFVPELGEVDLSASGVMRCGV